MFLTQALRAHLLRAEREGTVQVGPLRYPAVARAIEIMRSRLVERWTVVSLAREVGMSRTLFAARFAEAVGQAPMRTLTRLRLSRAAGALTTGDETVYAVARRAGYETEASFSQSLQARIRRLPRARTGAGVWRSRS